MKSTFLPYSFARRVGVASILGALLVSFGASIAFSATAVFTNVNLDLPGVRLGSVAWGDYDNDGRLDFLLTGGEIVPTGTGSAYVSRLYHNEGDGTFTWNTNVILPGAAQSSVAWADYDNDNRLDFLLTGVTDSGPSPFLHLYHNEGDGTFILNSDASLPNFAESLAWGDADNDGKLDLLLTGYDYGQYVSRLYHNNGTGSFTDINASLPGVYGGSVAWGDYDSDGWLDFLLAGHTNDLYSTISRIYHNNGDGTFTDIDAGLPGAVYGSVAWGDYDNNGQLDFLLTGFREESLVYISRIYRNNGNGRFTDINARLPGVSSGSAGWGDYDSDGRLDFLLTGDTGPARVSRLYHNNGDGTFMDSNAGLPGIWTSSVAWGDYDNDGRLDFLLTGHSDAGPISRLYHNNAGSFNSVPNAPTNLSITVTAASATLSWSAANDAQTPPTGLTYNLRVGITPGGSEIVSPQANPTNGFRLLPQMGNRQQTLSATLNHLPAGIYYWSVQAIDSAYAGSPFAAEASFAIARGVKENVLAELIALRVTVTDREDGRRLDEAIAHLTQSLAAEFWVDETHLERKHGGKVFDEEKETIRNLCSLIQSNQSNIPDATLQGFMDQLIRADRLLASVAIQEAIAANVSANKIQQAQEFLAAGDAEAADGKCADGIEDYRQAWKHAARAKVSPPVRLASGHVQLKIAGEAGERFAIQASASLKDWATIATRTANAEGIVMFEDADAARHPTRFYRVVID